VHIAKRVLNERKAKFLIAGDGPYFKKLKAEIKREKLGKWITLLGSVPNQEIGGLYQKADVFMMPSNEEGFPNVLLESMAMGTPFVATDIGGVRDIVCDSAQEFVVNKGDVNSFSEKMVELLSNKRARSRLSKDGLKHVKQYDVKRIAAQYVNAFRRT